MMKRGRSQKSNLISIGSVASQMDKKIQMAFRVSELKNNWKDVVGETLARLTAPKKWEQKVLVVAVDNPALHYEISLMKPILLEKLRQVTKTAVTNIRFVHESVKQGNIHQNGPKKEQKFERAVVQEDETLSEILLRVRQLSASLRENP